MAAKKPRPTARRTQSTASKNWVSVQGYFTHEGDSIIFQGDAGDNEGAPTLSAGHYISSQTFGGGTISATVRFQKPSGASAFQLVLYSEPATSFLLGAGIVAGDFLMYG